MGSTPSVSFGSRGEDVRNLQKLLNFHLSQPRPPLKTDGNFGSQTDGRVKEFQRLNRLDVDGIVGQFTRRALLDVRTITSGATIRPTDRALPARGFAASPTVLPPVPPFQLPIPPLLQPGQGPFTPPPAPRLTLAPAFAVTVQAGSQVAFNPWFISPLVVTAQVDILVKNDGRPPFTISGGVQGALNTSVLKGNSPGVWTGQGFIQFGPNLGAGKVSDTLDLLNPFVQIFIQKNANQPPALGLAIGNQSSWTFLRSKDKDGKDVDVLSLVLNAQVVTAVDLTTGHATGPLAGQVFLGVGHSF